MPNPRVTVLMAVYNSESYLREAIESILNQSFRDFEFLIIDDGSTDSSPGILAAHAALDARIVLNPNPTNMGHANSLNKGLDVARGEYVARMDSDDISLSDRLLRQVALMDAHPNVGVCGTWLRYLGGSNSVWALPQDDTAIRCYLFFNSPIAHPTAMLRKSVIDKHHLRYQQAFDPTEDYALWSEAAKYTSFANLPEVLFLYRVHNTQLTATRRARMLAATDKVRLQQVARLGIEITDEIAEFHPQVIMLGDAITKEFITKADAWLQKLQAANQQTKVFPEPAFSARLDLQWYFICRAATQHGMFAWHTFWNSPLSKSATLRTKDKLRFWMLCAAPWLRLLRRQAPQVAL